MSDRGSVTIWMLGLSLLLLVFGGLSIDFWRALAMQRHLAAVADSAALAAASGIDEEAYRMTGRLIIQPERAGALATASVAFQDVELRQISVTVDPAGSAVTVDLEGELDFGLLVLLTGDSDPVLIGATATATPTVVP